MSEPTKRRFEIAGMHCTSCAITIDWEIEDLPGVAESRTSYADARTEVVFDPDRVSEAEILAAIGRAGFTARAAEPA